MKNYIVHLHPAPYGFEIQANSAEEAEDVAKERWEINQDYDFDVDDQEHTFEVIAETE